jgi:broad specificity phosphatase PhoE
MLKPPTLVLVRHGETTDNVYRVVQGQTHGKLTGRGVRQARAAAGSLADTHIDAAYTSDLRRAYETAAIILEGRHDIELSHTGRLREQYLGKFAGGPVDEYLAAMDRAGAARERFDPDGGEPSGDMRERVEEFLADISRNHAGETVLVVTHKGVMRMIGLIAEIEVRAENAETFLIELDARR